MATTGADIIAAALPTALANDLGRTSLANNTQELLGVISRDLRSIYYAAALPPDDGGDGYGNYFTRTATLTLGTPATTPVALPSSPEFCYYQNFVDNVGAVVNVVTLRDLRDSVADYPPAVVIADNKIRSAGRTGDPQSGAVLTFDGSYLPPALTLDTDYLGATTPTDATTTSWPSGAGDPYLINRLALYLAQKDGARDEAEIQGYLRLIEEAAQKLAKVVGATVARFNDVRPA